MDLSIPDAVIDNLGVVLLVVGGPLALYLIFTNLTEGFLPPKRRKVPGAGKLTKMVSPKLQAFVASLPRSDALAQWCKPLVAEDIPLYASRPRAVMPLWKGPDGPLAAWITHSRGVPTKLQFVRFTPLAPKARDNHETIAATDQGFLAWFLMRVLMGQDVGAESMNVRDMARKAADALGFRYLDDVLAWHRQWLAALASPDVAVKQSDDDDDEAETPRESAEYQAAKLVDRIDEKERG
jgi:hypothetical protein